MSVIEVLLLIVGAAILTAGYLIPAGKKDNNGKSMATHEKEIRELIEKEVASAKGKIEDIVDETVSYSVEKTERSMERVSNEKIMAINEYSDTVLDEIHKNHEEAVFLYDMLNNKHENLITTVSEAGKTVAEVKQTLQDAQVTVMEAKEVAKERKEEVLEEVAERETLTMEMPEEEIVFEPIRAAQVTDLGDVLPTPGEEPELIEDLIIPVTALKSSNKKKKEPAEPRKKKASREIEDFDPDRVSLDIQLNKGPALGGNNNDKILQMHKAGKSNMAIAKELGLGIGEVKLVIDLYKGHSD